MPQELLEFIGKINTASVPTRYPQDLQDALQEYPMQVVENYLDQTQEVLKWLKACLTPS
jgi:HEPN domain-containing protein